VKRCLWLGVCVCLLTPALALAQDGNPFGGGPSGPRKAPDTQQMYEDIEIMRRLLVRKLDAVSPLPAVPTGTNLNQFNPYFFQPSSPWQQGLHTSGNWYGPQLTGQHNPFGSLGGNPLSLSTTYWPNNYPLSTQNVVWWQPSHDVEGVYLKGQGGVFTVTLPSPQHSPLPEEVKPEPKPPSDWEVARQQLHGEKPPAADKKQERKHTSIADALLKVLADNGHHFSQLAAKESLTVVVTFRKGDGHADHAADQEPGKQKIVRGQAPEAPLTGTGATSDAGLTGPAGKDPASSARDHELLGDLHLKQGKATEAAASYGKALKLLKDQGISHDADAKHEEVVRQIEQAERRMRELRIKLAQALLAAGNVEAAREALDKTDRPNITVQAAEKKPVVLPAKLILSAPKELLDLVGSGKMTFEEFKKAATVDYLTFGADAKKAGEK
jgi:hypothetical protein